MRPANGAARRRSHGPTPRMVTALSLAVSAAVPGCGDGGGDAAPAVTYDEWVVDVRDDLVMNGLSGTEADCMVANLAHSDDLLYNLQSDTNFSELPYEDSENSAVIMGVHRRCTDGSTDNDAPDPALINMTSDGTDPASPATPPDESVAEQDGQAAADVETLPPTTVVETLPPTTVVETLPPTTTTIPAQPAGVFYDASTVLNPGNTCWSSPQLDECLPTSDAYPVSQLALTHYSGAVAVLGVNRFDSIPFDNLDNPSGGTALGDVPLLAATGEEFVVLTVELAKESVAPATDADPVDVTVTVNGVVVHDFANTSSTATLIASVPAGAPVVVTMTTLGDTQSIEIGAGTATRTTTRLFFYTSDPSLDVSSDQQVETIDVDGESSTGDINVDSYVVATGSWLENRLIPSYVSADGSTFTTPGRVLWLTRLRLDHYSWWNDTGLEDSDGSFGAPATCDVVMTLQDGSTVPAASCEMRSGLGNDSLRVVFDAPDGVYPTGITVNGVTASGPDGTVTVGSVTIPVTSPPPPTTTTAAAMSTAAPASVADAPSPTTTAATAAVTTAPLSVPPTPAVTTTAAPGTVAIPADAPACAGLELFIRGGFTPQPGYVFEGPLVTLVQQRLIDLGYGDEIVASGGADGYMGAGSMQALQLWVLDQFAAGVPQEGVKVDDGTIIRIDVAWVTRLGVACQPA